MADGTPAPILQSAQRRDQLLHWLAEQLPMSRIEVLCAEHDWEVPPRRVLWDLKERYKNEITGIRDTWQSQMWNDGLANKDTRLAAEIAQAQAMLEMVWDENQCDFSGRPKYAMRDLTNLLELIGRETGQIGVGTGADDNRFQMLIQNIYNGIPQGEHAKIEVGTKGRLLSPVGVSPDVRASTEGALLDSAPIPARGRRRQRKVLPDGEGSGAARPLPAGDGGGTDN
jgi:hypothetical protein